MVVPGNRDSPYYRSDESLVGGGVLNSAGGSASVVTMVGDHEEAAAVSLRSTSGPGAVQCRSDGTSTGGGRWRERRRNATERWWRELCKIWPLFGAMLASLQGLGVTSHVVHACLRLVVVTWEQFQYKSLDGLMQKRCNSSAEALELHLFCIIPLMLISGCKFAYGEMIIWRLSLLESMEIY